ncbi:hypothetical protein E1200_03655 [Actinomadura sp. GC306]|uniref:hypothetical protein n=1 Tax=Actinomadura sp. GC306 TaxID=2530367 RepID=UPI001052F289|nr:hypothetical protein [Actinomadura sp. GC306]TDC70959.1 hypothetical protein E1200_03655 [Actinomadura sp. GC306]
MTAFTQHNVDDDPGPGPRIARCRLPGGRAATGQIRRTVHGALRGWGLGPLAGDLTDQLTALVQELLARTASRPRGPIDLRLELRASARLLLGEIHHAAPDPAPESPGRGIVALTYGRRPARDGVRYVHSFTWWHQDALTADH